MAWVHEQLSRQFYQWEQPGRGWQVWPVPVPPEPPFRPFRGYALPKSPVPVDDGRRPTALSAWVRGLSQKLTPQPPPLPPEPAPEDQPEPESLVRSELIELQVSLPAEFDPAPHVFAEFLGSLAYLHEPIAFELLGLPETISTQFAVHPADVASVQRRLQAHFPEAVFTRQEGVLAKAWEALTDTDTAVVEFGLAREFAFPLACDAPEVLVGLTAALEALQPGELGLFQVLFQPVRHPWADSLIRAVSDNEGKPVFVNAPGLLVQGKRKVSQPLFAAVIRVAVRSEEFGRAWEIARDMASALSGLSDVQGNELIPLGNDNYPFDDHADDVCRRQSRRSGMVLNRDELLGFVHLPSASVRSPKLKREVRKTKAAPKLSNTGVLLGHNTHAGETQPVYLSPEARVRHMHLLGASGTGKSTLLFNLIRQDIKSGEGLAVLDPHGDLVDRILGVIPPERIDDVVLVDPSDEQFSVGFNFLSAHSDLEKNLLASDLVSVFQRLSTSWGDQMGSVLQNAILAFLESSRGGTLADLRRFLIEPKFREQFLKTVRDPDIVYYWRKGFAQLSGNKSIGPVLTRLETFLSPKPIRYMVAQDHNRLDFADILDSGKVFLAKLPQGQMGKENSFLLGSLFVAKFQQLVMGRQAQRIESRRPFYLYIDEFQNFITPSMAEILSGARKYRLGLILAHQELRQLERDREVASAVLSNPFTRVVFRVGDNDARTLENGFADFEARDLQNLETGQAICRIEKASGDFNLSIPAPEDADPAEAEATRQAVITASREKYARARADIEAELLAQYQHAEECPLHKTERAGRESPASAVPVKVEPTLPSSAPLPTVREIIRQAPVEKPLPSPSESATEIIVPRDLGRGGAQHQAIQQRIKLAAAELGFRATIEKEVLQGAGSVDLLLERSERAIACEISITTSIDHEVGNVAKCLKAGFQSVVVICLSEERLEKIKAAVEGSLGAEATADVSYFQPDQFISHLQALPSPKAEAPEAPKIRKGYKVKHQLAKLSPEERRHREEAAIHSIKEVMRRRVKK